MSDDPVRPDPAELKPDTHELVAVFDTADETEAQVVQGLLEASGIESLLSSLDAQQDILPGVGGNVVKVRADQAEEARAVIDTYKNTTLEEVEEAEAESEEGPAGGDAA